MVESFEFTLEQPVGAHALDAYSSPVRTETGEVVGRVWVTRDVTQERALEEQLRQSQKMETLGTLAGGVAHDFNNQLTAILGNARLALDSVPDDPELRGTLLELERAAEHCAQLTRGLLTFARRAPARQQAIDAARAVWRGRGAAAPDAAPVDRDPRRDRRRACSRASATRRRSSRSCSISASTPATRSATRARSRSRRATARWRRGLRRAAERAAGALPRALGARRRRRHGRAHPRAHLRPLLHHQAARRRGPASASPSSTAWCAPTRAGSRWRASPARGSLFRVWLPGGGGAGGRPRRAASAPARRAGSERILLAEDEPLVRRVARVALEREGYTVLEACDGLEAVECLRDRAERVDLAVLDLSMPRMGGTRGAGGAAPAARRTCR